LIYRAHTAHTVCFCTLVTILDPGKILLIQYFCT
jgi:hypothetical protein